MDKTRLDAAVEVAIRKWYADDVSHTVEPWQVEYMRAALLAAMPVLLGEPVAWQWRLIGVDTDLEWVTRHNHLMDSIVNDPACETRTLYAPSLGEGDGR